MGDTAKTPARCERAKFWRQPELGNLELLRATYITHAFCRHIHEAYTIGVIEQGVEKFAYQGETHFAPVGTLVIVNRMPPYEYLTQVRVLRAKSLLSQGYAIAQVAQQTGFTDRSHLTRQFKRFVGVTPGKCSNST